MTKETRRETELRALLARFQLSISDLTLYDRALTHASIEGAEDSTYNYESLEFLGDAVLGLAVAHDLFGRIPDSSPGEYSRMRASVVNRKVVARVGTRLGIAEAIRLGKGEEAAGGRARMALVSDCMEALIGAIYLDHGWEAAHRFVLEVFAPELEHAPEAGGAWDYKSRLQQYCQAKRLPLPVFRVLRAVGPDHRKEFEVEVFLRNVHAGSGTGLSKKEAEQHAARIALEREGVDIG